MVRCLAEGLSAAAPVAPLPPPPALRTHVVKDFINHVDITAQIWGASCLNICNIVLSNSCQ